MCMRACRVHMYVCLLCLPLFRWVLQKQPKPIASELVRFPSYPTSEDKSRGTTVLPYLEVYYNYNEDNFANSTQAAPVTQDRSQFSQTLPPGITSMHSDSDSRISQYKSRIPSQENGEWWMDWYNMYEIGNLLIAPSINLASSMMRWSHSWDNIVHMCLGYIGGSHLQWRGGGHYLIHYRLL